MVLPHMADYVVGAVILLIPLLIGIMYAVRDRNRLTREEYLLGGRSMAILPVALSLFITFQSSISLIGYPAEVFSYGSSILTVSIGYSLTYFIGMVTSAPVMVPLHITSIYEYFELRYKSKAVRIVCSFIGLISILAYMAIALLAPSVALQATLGLPLWMTVIVFGLIGTLYTALGGIKSVVWTDAFQTVIVFVGIIGILITGCIKVGGVGEVWRLAKRGDRTNMGYVRPDPRVRHNYWGTLLVGVFMWMSMIYSQSTLQRISSLGTVRKARIAFLVTMPVYLFYCFTLVVMGNVIYAYYAQKGCDPFQAGYITNGNQIAPYFVLETMRDLPGMIGLYVSTLCCGSLSTFSSGINAAAAITVQDLLPRCLTSLKESMVTWITKLVVAIYGILSIALAYAFQGVEGPLTQISITLDAVFATPLVGLFLLGGLIPWVNKYGALVGAIVAFIFNAWINIGRFFNGRSSVLLEPITSDNCPVNAPGNGSQITVNSAWENGSSTLLQYMTSVPNTTASGDPDVADVAPYGFFLYDISYEWHGVMGTTVALVFGLLGSYFTKNIAVTGKTQDASLLFPSVRRFWKLPRNSARKSDDSADTDLKLKVPLTARVNDDAHSKDTATEPVVLL